MKNLVAFLFILSFLLACDSPTVKRDRFFLQGNVALDERDYKKAIRFYQNAIEIDDQFAAGYNNLGVALMEEDRPFEAIQAYNTALLIDPEYWDCLENRARAYEITGKEEKALNDYTRLSQQFPDKASHFFGIGLMHTTLKNYPEARSAFNQVLNLDAANVDAMINLGNLSFFEGDIQMAKSQLNAVIQDFPNHSMVYNSLNQVLLAEGNYNAALDAINQALKLSPGNALYLNNQGYTLLKTNRLEEAILAINQSIVIDPENKFAFRNKGIYFYLQGDCDQAKRYLEIAATATPPIDSAAYYLNFCQD